jgi:hypothetical protein
MIFPILYQSYVNWDVASIPLNSNLPSEIIISGCPPNRTLTLRTTLTNNKYSSSQIYGHYIDSDS